MTNLKTAFLETRPQFLLLSVVLVMVGTGAAYLSGYRHITHTILALIGLVALHISVNVLNDYHDFKTGIDLHTTRTPFSGGSGLLPIGRIPPETARRIGLTSLGIGCMIGIYFTFTAGWEFLMILLPGIFMIYAYNPLLSTLAIGEMSAGLGLGFLPVVGIYFIITGKVTPLAFFAGVPPFLLTFNLLFLNEFPDAEADRMGGRRHIVIRLGKRKAGILYTFITLLTYLWVPFGILMGIFPSWTLLSLLTLPFAIRAIKGALMDYDQGERLVPAQGANVAMVLLTQALLAVGFFLAAP
ncbi:MAG: prenyltransferase [bacterium]